MGASTSIIVFSCLNKLAPSFMIFSATASSTRPSRIKCFLSTSTLGFPRLSNTSGLVNKLITSGGDRSTRIKTIQWKI
ncbi:hypothetical protein BpHYR1_053461, partial [Brachionus plicatilis]